MKCNLTIIAGTLFAIAGVFYFIAAERHSAPAVEHISERAESTRPAPAAPSQKPDTPPSSSVSAKVSTVVPPSPTGHSPATPVTAYQPQPGSLKIPVAGIVASQLSDSFNEMRGGKRPHEAIDIPAPRGTPVLAVDDGKVVKLFQSKPGGLTVYQFDPSEKLAYYYAHLDGYAPGLAEGQQLKRGDLVGYLGSTGNANPAAPHLHFAVFELGPEKHWWQGTAINPYPMFTGR